MSRYRGPRLRIVRRLGELPELTTKISKKQNPPGELHAGGMKKLSQYNLQLREKQKLRFNYGISEKQLINYVKKSRKGKESSGRFLLTLLEMRLDTIILRLGLAPTIMSARQIISHKHILVNEKCVNIPSYQCLPNDVIEVKKTIKSKNLIEKNQETLKERNVAPHLMFNKTLLKAKINSLVNRNSIDLNINELLVIEYYSRKI
uniref:Small ribosomal subunit protein uS4c n=1 Tax=Eutreptia sp. CCAC 1914B TaxID=2979827 RepID=A0A977K856_9EUGL|nr:ribosomal protein S4 [Eutreptia sp. CCAC 1914B]